MQCIHAKLKLSSRSNSKRLSGRYHLSTDAIFWGDNSGGDTECVSVAGMLQPMPTAFKMFLQISMISLLTRHGSADTKRSS